MNAAVRAATVLLGALVLAGCGAQSAGGGPGTTPTGPGTAPSSSSTLSGLRGVRAARIDCSLDWNQTAAKDVRLLPGSAVRIVICPLKMPNASGPPTDLTPPPPALVRALSLSDKPRPRGVVACAAYADVPQVVYAQTADGQVFLLWVPIDLECNHYLPAALTALNQYAHLKPVG